MNLENQYIVQAITVAANNLRLSSEKIEVVSLLRKHLSETENIYDEIQSMKKVTELSKLAIKLGQIFQFISADRIDFMQLSDQFKEDAHKLVIELSNVLDRVSPTNFREIISPSDEEQIKVELGGTTQTASLIDEIKTENRVVLENTSENETIKNKAILESSEVIEEKINETKEQKEELILEELNEEKSETFDFEEYEKRILEPIKELEKTLKQINQSSFDLENLDNFIEIMLANAKLSEEIGFDIISNMHKVVAFTFRRLKSGKLIVSKNVEEGVRACLIVIVAVVRSKDVDITSYLKKAEEFGNYILRIK